MKQYKTCGNLEEEEEEIYGKNASLCYNAGRISNSKYGNCNLRGSILMLNKFGNILNYQNKEIVSETSNNWLKELHLNNEEEETIKAVIAKFNIPNIIVNVCPDVDYDKCELVFKYLLFSLLIEQVLDDRQILDDEYRKYVFKCVNILMNVVKTNGKSDFFINENLEKIIKNFNILHKLLITICVYSEKHMKLNEYARFKYNLANYVRVKKWQFEYAAYPYTINDYILVRTLNIGVIPLLDLITYTKNINIPDSVYKHPLFERFLKNVALHVGFTNDILNLKSTIYEEKVSLILVQCLKYSLQTAHEKVENYVNDILLEIKTDIIKLKTYFANSLDVQNYIQSVEFLIDGVLKSYMKSATHGYIKFDMVPVEYESEVKNRINATNLNFYEELNI